MSRSIPDDYRGGCETQNSLPSKEESLCLIEFSILKPLLIRNYYKQRKNENNKNICPALYYSNSRSFL